MEQPHLLNVINLTTSYSQHGSRHGSFYTLITRENGLHQEIKHGRKLTKCIPTIAQKEKGMRKIKKTNETRKVSSIT